MSIDNDRSASAASRLRRLWGRFPRRDFLGDVFWLYVVVGLNYLVPLILLPYLARVLGAEGLGRANFAFACAMLLAFFVDYGFHISAQMEAAKNQQKPEVLAKLLADVTLAKVLLAIPASIVLITCATVVPQLGDARLQASIVALGLTQAFSLSWYFKGLTKIRLASALEALGKLVALLLVIGVVRDPSDVWKYCALLAVGNAAGLTISFFFVLGNTRLHRTSLADAAAVLNSTKALSGLSASAQAYNLGTQVFFGIVLPPSAFGALSGAEKIARIAITLLDPIRHAAFPRICRAIDHDLPAAWSNVGKLLILLLLASSFAAAVVYLFSNQLVLLFLGPGFAASVEVLKILAFLPLLVSANYALGLLWLVPRRFHRLYILLLCGAAVVYGVSGYWLWGKLGLTGVAYALIIAELVLTFPMLAAFFLKFVGKKI